jgi:hypothetical protein
MIDQMLATSARPHAYFGVHPTGHDLPVGKMHNRRDPVAMTELFGIELAGGLESTFRRHAQDCEGMVCSPNYHFIGMSRHTKQVAV